MEYTIIRSKRKTVSVEVKSDLSVVVRVPLRMSDTDITRFVVSKAAWIEKHIEIVGQRQAGRRTPYTNDEINYLVNMASEEIPKRVAFFSERLDVKVGNITIRKQKTRWGSCSSAGNLNFNCLLMLCPPDVRDYVVVHELIHRLEMNHSPRFWKKVESVLPDYKVKREWLKKEGRDIIAGLSSK